MLTQDDLKQIRSIVEPIAKDVQSLKTSAKSLETDIQTLKTDNNAFKRNFIKIHKDMNLVINFFDRDYLSLLGRVERIEKHLGISALS